jgi:hypothetical protein
MRELYVVIPISRLQLQMNNQVDHELSDSAKTVQFI